MRCPRLFCVLCCFLARPAYAAQEVILYGDDDYAPYSFVELGQFKGMYVDLLKLAAARLTPEYDVVLKPRPWKRGLAELQSGFSFGLFPPGRKTDRSYIDLYSVPMYRETVVMFCNDSVMASSRKSFPADFAGLTIGVNAGFLLSERLIDAAGRGIVKLAESKGNEGNLRKLALKRIDCYASDRAAALYTIRKSGAELAGLNLSEAVELSGEETFIAYSMANNPPYKADFFARMNAALTQLKKSGAVARIEQSYLK